MEQLKKIQELTELLSKYSHGFGLHPIKKRNIFDVLLIIGQIDDYKDIDINDLKILENLIKSFKRLLLLNKI